ncbi:MAG TPA: DUF190 domain-containing protein, partial [Pirellulales bacterium]|nr:DUF190 domain-containing protein [Pirellulales bacterium]
MTKIEGEQLLLRLYLRNTDKHGLASASDALVEHARRAGLAGATVLRGTSGIDFHGKLLERRKWSLVEHVPVIVEFVDRAEAIVQFLRSSASIVPAATVATLERAHVLVYRSTAPQVAGGMSVPAPVADLATLPEPEELPMQSSTDGQMLRIFIGDSDSYQGQPLATAIVHRAHELGIAGATVLHGVMGFGAASRIHTSRLLEL